jgi:UDP-N-acetyl-D-mannosaminuronic acid dehydrogenase
MALVDLQHKFETKTARLGVIGLGYVGLAVACKFAEKGFVVRGLERRAEVVNQINAGRSPIQGFEPGLEELLQAVTAGGCLTASVDPQVLTEVDVVLVAVETPVEPDTHQPTYAALKAALTTLGQRLKAGQLVIIESTIAPGTMEGVAKPTLEAASGLRVDVDFYLGHCPERVMPGRLLRNLALMSRVCGGHTPETSQAMRSLYRQIVEADLDMADCVTAEMVKTTENAYRDVQIAFANEVAMLCEQVGADVWRVRELVNKSPDRNFHMPGPGVGGHCIPKDPWLLIHPAVGHGQRPRLIPAARRVNDDMPLHMVALLESALQEAGQALAEARVAVLGYAYLENSDDTRNSPTETLVTELRKRGAQVVIHDPFVPEYQGDLQALCQGADAAVIMVRHDAYRAVALPDLKAWLRRPVLVDGRRVFEPEAARKAHLIFRAVGRGQA